MALSNVRNIASQRLENLNATPIKREVAQSFKDFLHHPGDPPANGIESAASTATVVLVLSGKVLKPKRSLTSKRVWSLISIRPLIA